LIRIHMGDLRSSLAILRPCTYSGSQMVGIEGLFAEVIKWGIRKID
jgi:hypothetical protein